ncbi:hypothetical protein ACSS6W_000844 [Trichoderma asperelloides]
MSNANFRLFPFLSTLAICFIVLRGLDFFRKSDYDVLPISAAGSLGEGLSPEEQYLARLNREFKLTNETEWLSWRFRHARDSTKWTAVNSVHNNFGSQDAKVVFTEHPNPLDVRVTHRMELPALGDLSSKSYDASELVFGITTTYDKIMDREGALLRSWTRWLTNGHKKSNGASLVLMLDQAGKDEVKELEDLLRTNGVDAQVFATGEPMSLTSRYHELAHLLKSFGAILSSSGGAIKRWYALVEDDVFFPDVSYLQHRLASYKIDEEVYIGLPSEQNDWEATRSNTTTTTYGGGAVFLTRPALDTLSKLTCFEMPELRDRFHAKRWDVLLKSCFAWDSDVKMNVLPGFHNPDIEVINLDTDAYESGIRPLILHDALGRHGMDVNVAHLVTNVCDTCFMQRYEFHDNWVLTVGVSISEHFDNVKHHSKNSMAIIDNMATDQSSKSHEVIIDDAGVDRTELIWTENRRVWEFADSVMSDDGAVWQAYIDKAVGEPGPDNIDSVIILVWENMTR